jgi:hypothetical protein
LKRHSTAGSSVSRESESPSSINSHWDHQEDYCDQFVAQKNKSTSVYLSTEESRDYSIDALWNPDESPTHSNDEWRTLEQDLNFSLLNTPLSGMSLPFESANNRYSQDFVDHFRTVFSHLPALQDQNVPLFRQSSMSPTSQASSPVQDILLAFSCFQFEEHGVQNEKTSLYFHNKALQGLIKLLDNLWEGNAEEILSTIMLLVYYEIVGAAFFHNSI